MQDIASNNSIVRCNFDPGYLGNVEDLVERHPTWTPEVWAEHYKSYQPEYWETVPPLPKWGDLILDSCNQDELEEE